MPFLELLSRYIPKDYVTESGILLQKPRIFIGSARLLKSNQLPSHRADRLPGPFDGNVQAVLFFGVGVDFS